GSAGSHRSCQSATGQPQAARLRPDPAPRAGGRSVQPRSPPGGILGGMSVTFPDLVLTDAQIERVATRVAEILSERRDRAERAFLFDVQERGFETVMVEGIKALRETAGSQADRASAH